MRIVVDTNVLISGVFFGGFPRKILNAVVESRLTVCATTVWPLVVQLVTISRPTAYGEYAPYHFVDTEQEFHMLERCWGQAPGINGQIR